jgi:S1-C subfamily serine protease
MTVRPLSAEERKDLDVQSGVIVSDVRQYSEAYNRFLTKNTVILEADRKEVNSPEELKRIVEGHKPGDALLLRVKSDRGPVFLALQIPK